MKVDLNDVAVFAAVVEAKSFAAAARNLGMPPSVVSRRVARLEANLGVRLLHRTTRSLGLTEPGRIYFSRAASLTHGLEDAAREMNALQDTPAGLIRMTAPPDDNGVLWALVSGFLQAHPEVDLEITHTLEYVDLVEQGIDVALRGGSVPDTADFKAVKLWDSRMLLVASPEYLARRGTPQSLDELDAHDCIAMDNWSPNALRHEHGSNKGPMRVDARNRVRSNRLETVRAAALAGLGVAPMIAFNCADELADGSLVEVIPGTFRGPAPFWVLYPSGGRASAATRALVDHIVETAPKLDRPDG